VVPHVRVLTTYFTSNHKFSIVWKAIFEKENMQFNLRGKGDP
jgi:hypothetical protein